MPSIKVPWSKMKSENIINWPIDLKFVPIYGMNTNDLKRLYKLAQKDRLDFSPEFLSQFNIISKEPRYLDELRSDLTKYLAEKLAKKMNVPSIKIPWAKMRSEDIINWPSGIKFRPAHKMSTKELKRLHELTKEDLLDFTPDFLNRLKKNIGRDQLRSELNEYLGAKLAKRLNRLGTRVPWSRMKEGDIINWPPEVEFMPFLLMNMESLKRLKELSKKDLLDFSPEFLKMHSLGLISSA